MSSRKLQIASALACLGLMAGPASAFDIPEHDKATEELRKIVEILNEASPGDEYSERFTEQALEEIRSANESTDDIITGSAAAFHPERHFTDDKFRDSTQRLMDLKAEILELVRRPMVVFANGREARKKVGQALHLIQDFYAHSTWVETGQQGINRDLGRRVVDDPGPNVRPCRADPNEIDNFTALSTAYFLGVTGCQAIILLPVTEESPSTLDSAIAPGKCYHGNYMSRACRGTSKDLTEAAAREASLEAGEEIPFRQAHHKALELARAATLDYVEEQILGELDGDDTAKLLLLGLISPLTYLIDDTASMGAEIARVKTAVRMRVDRSNGPVPAYYGLIRLNDPDITDGPITDDKAEFLAALDAIVPSGGGDGPEPSNAALLRAIQGSLNTSRVILYTNEMSKDPQLADEVEMRFKEKDISISTVMLPPCLPFAERNPRPCAGNPPPPVYAAAAAAPPTVGALPIDPVYLRLAEATGGRVIQGSTDTDVSALDLPLAPADQALLAYARGRLAFARATRVPILVDATVTALFVAVSTGSMDGGSQPTIVLTPPVVGDPVATTETWGGSIFKVENPSAGTWQVEIRGGGEYLVEARATSPVRFKSFDFVESNDEVHEGIFPMRGAPVEGTPVLGSAALLGSIESADFELISETGAVLTTASGQPLRLPLAQGRRGASPDRYVGEVALPSTPFRVAVSGSLPSRGAYRRVFPKLYRARPVGIAVVGFEEVEASPGEVAQFEYRVSNVGSAATFTFSTLDELGFVTSVSPSQALIASGGSATVRVSARVTPQAQRGSTETIWLLARREGNSEVLNSAITRVEVTD